MPVKGIKTPFESIELKRDDYRIKITGYIRGTNKNLFINDCVKLRQGESKMIQHIIDVYYVVAEMDEVKRIINERIKL